MKRTVKRILSLALGLTLVLALASTASAATVGWIQNGTQYNLTVTVSSVVVEKTLPIPTAPEISHTKGTPTTLHCAVKSSVTATLTYTGSPGSYLTYLNQAIDKAELGRSSTINNVGGINYALSESKPTGIYRLGYMFSGNTATWKVYTGAALDSEISPIVILPNGTITFAPIKAIGYDAYKVS